MWCGRWRASGFAWCVRSQVVGIATRRGAWDETAARPAHARPAHARPAQAMRLTANTKRKLDCRPAHMYRSGTVEISDSVVFGSLCAVT